MKSWREYKLHDVYECNHVKKHKVRLGKKRFMRLILLGMFGWLDTVGYCIEYYPNPLNKSLGLKKLGISKNVK